MRQLFPISVFLVACNFTLDAQPQPIAVTGMPPDLSTLPRLNVRDAITNVEIMTGIDGAPWAYFSEALEPSDDPDAPKAGRRLVRLIPPEASELIPRNDVVRGATAVYIFDRGTATAPAEMTKLNIRSPGEPAPGAEFLLPKGAGTLVVGPKDVGTPSIRPKDVTFAYWPTEAGTTEYLVRRRNGAFARAIPLPPGVDAADGPSGILELAPDEENLLERHDDGRLLLHATSSDRTTDLGIRMGRTEFDPEGRSVVTCGAAGLRVTPVDGAADRVLDTEPCDPSGDLVFDSLMLYYASGPSLWRVPFDGSASRALVAAKGRRALTFEGATTVYSRDAVDAYAHASGDGFIGDWQFMTRGIDVKFATRDKLFWLENAARSLARGDLHTAPIDGVPQLLARNVVRYEFLADGRVLVADQHPFRGTFNRIVVLDTNARTGQWVAEAGNLFVRIPGTDDVLVDLITSSATFDIVRMTIPSP